MPRKVIGIIVAVLIALGAGYFIARQRNDDKPPAQGTQADTSNPMASGATLDLSGQQLTTLPDSVLSRTDITVLNLSNNQLTSLPSDISMLTNLEVLNVENNRLESLPAQISQLKKLREILANNNRMKSLPAELGNMTWLKLLDISGNNIPGDDVQQIKARLPNTQVKS